MLTTLTPFGLRVLRQFRSSQTSLEVSPFRMLRNVPRCAFPEKNWDFVKALGASQSSQHIWTGCETGTKVKFAKNAKKRKDRNGFNGYR